MRVLLRSCAAAGALQLLAWSPLGAEDFGVVDQKASEVSIIRLIAAPEKLTGAKVRVDGVVAFEGDGDFLCLSSEALRFGALKNCLAIELDYDVLGVKREELVKLEKKYVFVEGVFDGNDLGRWSNFSGTVKSINRIATTAEQSIEDTQRRSSDMDRSEVLGESQESGWPPRGSSRRR